MDKDTTKGIIFSLVWSPICYMGFIIVYKIISCRSVANLEQQRGKERNYFP